MGARIAYGLVRLGELSDPVPRPITEAILSSLARVVPDGVTLTVSANGRVVTLRTLERTDSGTDVLSGTLFRLNKQAAVRLSAKSIMSDVWHFVHETLEQRWPPGASADEPHHRIRIDGDTLHMAYTHDNNVLLECPPVSLGLTN